MSSEAYYDHVLGEWTAPPQAGFSVWSLGRFFSQDVIDNAGCMSVVIIGPPGSGKTSLTKYLVDKLGWYTKIITGSLDDWLEDSDKDGNVITPAFDILSNGTPVDVIPDEMIGGSEVDADEVIGDPEKYLKKLKMANGATVLELAMTHARVRDRGRRQERPSGEDTYTLVLDDVSDQLKQNSSGTVRALEHLLKILRHVPMHIIVVTHTVYDLAPKLRSLFRYVILTGLGGQTKGNVPRDAANYFGGELSYEQICDVTKKLTQLEAALVYKTAYIPEADNLLLHGSKIAGNVPAEWYHKSVVGLMVKAGLYRPVPALKKAPPREIRTGYRPSWKNPDDDTIVKLVGEFLGGREARKKRPSEHGKLIRPNLTSDRPRARMERRPSRVSDDAGAYRASRRGYAMADDPYYGEEESLSRTGEPEPAYDSEDEY